MTEMLRNTRVALDTLGCKLNQAETELLVREFAKAGYQLVSATDEVDIYILNTCTVTHIADRKSRHLLRLAQRRNPNAFIVAIGCYAQRASEMLSRLDEVDLVLGNSQKQHVLSLLEERGCMPQSFGVQDELPSRHYSNLRNRAFIKIQNGCDNFCAYCIVPLVRTEKKSLSAEQIITEVRARIAEGYKEVVLTGTDIGSYNHNGLKLRELLERILAETDVRRLRLSSLQPQEITNELVDFWHEPRLCCHFHLSLQSGSNEVLGRMKRHYSTQDFERAVALIRSLMPEVAITTDIIVGFPGETDSEFQESYSFCQKTAFARIHVFPYSSRPTTAAAQMPKQVTTRVKKQRSQKMLILAEESALKFREQFLGKIMPVLWEQKSNGIWLGLSDNYIKVYIRNDNDLTNELLAVKLVKIYKDGVWGEAENETDKRKET
jgi:threonylcarbamoyladenosine tRNA methylthiotransferase MtaB